MKVKIVQIGNSLGIRIPKALLDQYGLKKNAILESEADGLFIRSIKKTRQGWKNAFNQMLVQKEDQLLDNETATEWDKVEWEWK